MGVASKKQMWQVDRIYGCGYQEVSVVRMYMCA